MEPGDDAAARIAALLAEALPGLEPEGPPESVREGASGPDLRFRLGSRRVLVEVKRVAGPRIEDVQGRLSMAVLLLRRVLRGPRDVPLALVRLERFGSRLESEVRRFMADNAPDTGWGLIDARGGAVLEIPGLDLAWRREGEGDIEDMPAGGRGERRLFTDLNRWMLKILLLRAAPVSAFAGPRAIPRHPTDLAAIAGVSVEKAHRFVLAFETEGFLVRTGGGLKPARVEELLDAWIQQEAGERHRTLDVRPLLPAARRKEPPLPAAARSGAALGGSFAARERRMLHSGSPFLPLVHVSIPLEEAIRAWGLRPAGEGEAAVRLRAPRFPRSVFRAAVPRPGKLPLVDLWQAGLDAATADPRGLEQARYVARRVLSLQERP